MYLEERRQNSQLLLWPSILIISHLVQPLISCGTLQVECSLREGPAIGECLATVYSEIMAVNPKEEIASCFLIIPFFFFNLAA